MSLIYYIFLEKAFLMKITFIYRDTSKVNSNIATNKIYNPMQIPS